MTTAVDGTTARPVRPKTMRHYCHPIVLLLLAGFVAAGASAADPATTPTLEGRALVDALRSGGYVLYLRHTSTDFGENDAAMTTFDDCSKQRNLTDAGRAEARAIGAALRELKIPVGTVLASPYCRTLETGRPQTASARCPPSRITAEPTFLRAWEAVFKRLFSKK